MRVEIEIAAPPEEVRAVLLDFPNYPEWHTNFIKSVSTIPPTKPAISLIEGDKICAGFTGMTIEPLVTSNTPTEFAWFGSLALDAFSGRHYFRFEESQITPASTTFVHGEDYTGWMTFMFGKGWPLHTSVRDMYMGFSRDLKARVEELQRAQT
ncbi:hypothetical protein BDV95DRAFT_584667 [Massariosphaeria phaeospora]|uniref:SRPBCC domain-containing protein n=1 Tax=Massariosphaeria phaeospora TaxID=100035 RepID=A0A7C8HZL7_9PLEO|nr:hypothetical protein BDV95DRAFT_584667 [Massariosphaeria phaeospora]